MGICLSIKSPVKDSIKTTQVSKIDVNGKCNVLGSPSPERKKEIERRKSGKWSSFRDDVEYSVSRENKSVSIEPIAEQIRYNADLEGGLMDRFDWKSIFDNFVDGVIIVNKLGIIVYYNLAIIDILQNYSNSIINKNINVVLKNGLFKKRLTTRLSNPETPNLRNRTTKKNFVRTDTLANLGIISEKTNSKVLKYKTPNGKLRYLQIATKNINFKEENCSDEYDILTIKDITKQKQIQTELYIQYDKNKSIISSMLPETILKRIQNGEKNIADFHNDVTVAFCDIVGFTPMVSNMTPLKLVSFLDELFSKYDKIAEEIGVYKVETAGDNYMIACGLFGEENHSEKCIEFMIRAIRIINGKKHSMRAGIHRGSLASGVIGINAPHLNLFGDTVNIASRMESHSEPNKIQITDSVIENINVSKYNIECLGAKQIKGKGKMITYYIEH